MKNDRNKIGQAFRDIGSVIYLRTKLIYKDRLTRIVLVVSILLFAFLIQALSDSAEKSSTIPIGVVDYDYSDESRDFIERVKKLRAFRMIEEDEKELKEQLLDEMIYIIFVIEDGFQEAIRHGITKEVISVYSMEKYNSTSIIADVLAGEMMYPITLYKTYQYYDRLKHEEEKKTQTGYVQYTDGLLEGDDSFDFAFDMQYWNPDHSFVPAERLDHTVIYQQIVVGVQGILLSFIAMFVISLSVREKELGISGRMNVSRISLWKRDLGNWLTLFVMEAVLSVVFTVLVLSRLLQYDMIAISGAVLLSMELAMLMGTVFLLLAGKVKSIITYQMIGSILILIMGGLGFYQLLSGLGDWLPAGMLNFIPNNWFIRGITDIIVSNNRSHFIGTAHIRLGVLGLILMAGLILKDVLAVRGKKIR